MVDQWDVDASRGVVCLVACMALWRSVVGREVDVRQWRREEAEGGEIQAMWGCNPETIIRTSLVSD